MTTSAVCATTTHFLPSRSTGKERDAESGNDYFSARYYASSMGRFLSPDWSAKVVPVPYAKLDDPQSLNLYTYVRNNPLSRTDPTGHCANNDIDCLKSSGACGKAICGPPPRNSDGSLAPPRVPLPNGKNGEANEWVVKDGSGNRTKWGPKYQVPSLTGSQPQASWDDRNGKGGKDHWDVDWGGGTRTRVDADGNPVSPAEAHGMMSCAMSSSCRLEQQIYMAVSLAGGAIKTYDDFQRGLSSLVTDITRMPVNANPGYPVGVPPPTLGGYTPVAPPPIYLVP
jgi:RHS repeat-associated protein